MTIIFETEKEISLFEATFVKLLRHHAPGLSVKQAELLLVLLTDRRSDLEFLSLALETTPQAIGRIANKLSRDWLYHESDYPEKGYRLMLLAARRPELEEVKERAEISVKIKLSNGNN